MQWFTLQATLLTQNHLDNIVNICEHQACENVKVMAQLSTNEADPSSSWLDTATETLGSFYQQPGTSGYILDQAPDVLLILIERSKNISTTE